VEVNSSFQQELQNQFGAGSAAAADFTSSAQKARFFGGVIGLTN